MRHYRHRALFIRMRETKIFILLLDSAESADPVIDEDS